MLPIIKTKYYISMTFIYNIVTSSLSIPFPNKMPEHHIQVVSSQLNITRSN